MNAYRITRSGQDNWQPRKPMGDAERQRAYGPLLPMVEKPSIWRRLLGGVR
jgi:hypothetical protein